MDNEKPDINEFVIKVALGVTSLRETHPERYEAYHMTLLAMASNKETASTLNQASRAILQNYLMNWIHDDALKNGRTLPGEHSERIVDQDYYAPEMVAIHNLNDNASYGLPFKVLLYKTARETIDIFSNRWDMTQTHVLFPFASEEAKLSFADEYALTFINILQEKLALPFNPLLIEKVDDNSKLAFYIDLSKGDEEPIPFIGISERGLALDMEDFVNIFQHELVHYVIDNLGRREIKWDFDHPQPYHEYGEDIVTAQARSKNRDVTSIFFPSLYEKDREEELCNIVGAVAGNHIQRFNPNRQITRQPLLQI